MDKKVLIPILVLALSVAFVLLCGLVVVLKNKRITGAKLRIGGMLLSLTSLGTGCVTYTGCYAVPYNMDGSLPEHRLEAMMSGKVPNKEEDVNMNLRYNVEFNHKLKSLDYYAGPDFRMSHNTTGISYFLGPDVGIAKNINEKIDVFTEIDYHYKLNSNPEMVNQNKHSYGVNLGGSYRYMNGGISLYGRYTYTTSSSYQIGLRIFLNFRM